MKRIALILATFGILCVAVGQAQAGDFHHGYHGYHGYYGGHHNNVVVVRSPVWVAPRVVVPVPVYPPVYRPGCYYPAPAYGFYYQGRGLSIGVGF
jgi:hypothetical protein